MSLVLPAPVQLRIADSRDNILIKPVNPTGSDPVMCRSFDPGAPEPRTASQDLIGLDGTDDDTAYTGARTVTLELIVFGGPRPGSSTPESAYDWVERLASFAHPSRRPWLYVSRDSAGLGGHEWRLALRGNPFSIVYQRRAAALLELTLAFTAPDGLFESPLWGADGSGAQATEGLYFTAHFPVNFGSGGGGGAFPLTVAGSVPVAPYLYVYGPCVNPVVRTDNGLTFAFSSLTLADGEFVAVDMAAGTVRLRGDPGANVYHTVNWNVSTFWRFWPGTTRVSLDADGGGRLVVQWRDRRVSI